MPSATPTQESGDIYEPDLTAKRFVHPGEAQYHTFFPTHDIDQVTLLVQEGHRYVVMTCGTSQMPLSPILSTIPFNPLDLACAPLVQGVDTLLVVTGPVRNCEPTGCQSTDVLPGEIHLNSRVEFQAIANGEATIRVFNQGSYGAAQSYSLRAHEILAWTPVPLPASPTPPAYSSNGQGTGSPLAVRISDGTQAIKPLLSMLRSPHTQTEAESTEFAIRLELKRIAP